MPVIRISDATWKRMKRHATPLEDTPEDVVKRALDALEGAGGQERPSAPPALQPVEGPSDPLADAGGDDAAGPAKLPQRAFRFPLAQTLCELGGSGPTKDIRDALLRKMTPLLGPQDFAAVSSGDPRWWNAVCWERNAMVNEGLMRKDSPRGSWELTDQGVQLIGGTYEFVFSRDFPVSVDGRVFQFMKGQNIPGEYFGRAVRDKWPMEPVKPTA